MFYTVLYPLNLHESIMEIISLTETLKNFDVKIIYLLTVVTGGEESRAGREAKHKLEKIRKQIADPSFDVELLIQSGHVPNTINDTAERLQVDFICFPWKKKPFFQHALLGSITRDVIRISEVPLFIYKKGQKSVTDTRLRRVLYASDCDANDRTIMPYLKHEGFAAEELVIVNVGERAPDPRAERKRFRTVYKKMRKLEQEVKDYYAQTEVVVTIGNPKRQILSQSRRAKVDLVVMGKFTESGPLSKVMGSTAETVAQQAKASVFIIPRKGQS